MSWYANLKIRNKLLLGYLVVVVLSGLIGYLGISGMKSLKTSLDDTHDNLIHSIVICSDTDHHTQQHLREFLRYLLSAEPVRREASLAGMKKEEGQVKETFSQLEAMPLLPKEREMLSTVRTTWGTYLATAGRILTLADGKGQVDVAMGEKELIEPLFAKLEEQIAQLRSFNVEESDEHYVEGGKSYADLRLLLSGLSVSLVGLAVLMALFVTRSVTRPLTGCLAAVRSLAEGGMEKARLSEAIANGDLSRDVTPSEPLKVDPGSLTKDEAGALLRSVVSMSESQSALDRAFARMTDSLRVSRSDEQKSDWLKTGLNRLNGLMRGEQKTLAMADQVLTFLAEYLKAGAAAFYLYDSREESLVLAATYALTRRKNLGERFALGEGLIGQAALEQKMICLAKVPPDYLQIVSALGEASPLNVVALPLVHNGQLAGALELGTFTPFNDTELEFLNQAVEGIAIGLGVATSRQRINELLEQTQQQTEELRVQQEELQQTNEELEERAEMLDQQRKQIQAKNLEIEETSSEIKRKALELEKVSAYKSEFLANMSHELRTPLNSMMILSNLLMENKEGTLSEKQQEFAATINSAGKDLLNLINDILDLSKVEAGHLELHYEQVAVRSFCETLETLFRPEAEKNALQFNLVVDPEVPESVTLDEQRTLQIMKNLLANAFKFTQQGSVELGIAAADATTSPLAVPALAMRVKDSGIGIPPDKHHLIFQAFQQADGSTSRKYGGTGLGLSISLQLARRMGGELTLVSEPGQGSEFTLWLPLAAVDAEKNPAPPPAAATSAPAVAHRSTNSRAGAADGVCRPAIPRPLPDDRDRVKPGDKCILVVEDDLNFAKTLMLMIREKGFACIVAADGTSGYHLADLYQPSAIILDVMLPGLDGWGVMRGLKDNPATRHIPVHFITCLDERQKAMAMGAVGFVTKPVSPQQLEEVFDTIEKTIARSIGKLLIIEDNPNEAESLVNLLRDRNLTISLATTGRAAIDQLAAEQVDCIVLDLGLPDMSGFDFLEHLHKTEELRSIPVIIHTARDLSREEEVKLRHYAQSIIIKGGKSHDRLLNEATLFLHMVESELPPEKQQMIRSALDKEAMLEGKKVLIADDDMRNVFSLSSILTDKKMEILEAENGREALTRLEENPEVNIVLMDIMMPEMDGYEAIRTLRRDPRFKDLPVIAMTAKAMKGDEEKCLQAGANDYISKPLDIEKLLSLLRVWLYRQTKDKGDA